MMLGCALVTQLAAWAAGGPVAGWSMAALPVLAGALVRTHFDLFPTALALVGLALIVTNPRRGAVELGFLVLALGTMTKLWPAALAAVAFCWLLGRGERRTALRAGAIFALVVLAAGIPFAALGGFPSKMVEFHLDRPVQIESTAASVLELTGGSHVTGDPVAPDRFKSNGLDGGAADAVAALSTLALLLAAALILRLAARRPTARGPRPRGAGDHARVRGLQQGALAASTCLAAAAGRGGRRVRPPPGAGAGRRGRADDPALVSRRLLRRRLPARLGGGRRRRQEPPAACGAGRHGLEHLLDRRCAQRLLGAADDDAHQPRIVPRWSRSGRSCACAASGSTAPS